VGPLCRCAPSMGADLEVKVLPRAGFSEGSEAQGRLGDLPSGGRVERSCGPMNKNRIRGVDDWGERANDREAPETKGTPRISGGRAVKVGVLTWGDLVSGLKGSRGSHAAEREVSRGRSRQRREAVLKDRTMGRV
jgi:hypothetical protein